MTTKQMPSPAAERLDASAEAEQIVGAPERFGNGELWIGTHAVDGDVLVFDPAEANPTAERLSFYSMTQLRCRVFPRAVVAQKVRALTDELQIARVKKDYANRAELRAVRDQELAASQAAAAERQRQLILGQHERYLTGMGIPYKGVRPTPPDHRAGRRVRCHECGIALDDFTGSVCGVCSTVLCSCGACMCGGRARSR